MLVVLIKVFGPISGAHFNPAVTLAFMLRQEIEKLHTVIYDAIAAVFIAGHLAYLEKDAD